MVWGTPGSSADNGPEKNAVELFCPRVGAWHFMASQWTGVWSWYSVCLIPLLILAIKNFVARCQRIYAIEEYAVLKIGRGSYEWEGIICREQRLRAISFWIDMNGWMYGQLYTSWWTWFSQEWLVMMALHYVFYLFPRPEGFSYSF